MTEIIVALITAFPLTLAAILSNRNTNKKLDENQRLSNRNDAKQSILQMMMEDKVVFHLDHRLPENYQRIHEEYDHYRANGGNSYMKKKMAEYDTWYAKVEHQLIK